MRAVDPADFRRVAGSFASGIVVVTTTPGDVGHAMTVSAFASVSLDPVLVLFCAEKVARLHDAVLASGKWAVSVLGEESEKVAQWLAARGRPLDGQLDAYRHHVGEQTSAPILDDAIAALECRTIAVHDAGDHSIVVGEVIGVTGPQQQSGPLIHYAGSYHRIRTSKVGPGYQDAYHVARRYSQPGHPRQPVDGRAGNLTFQELADHAHRMA
jgi:flavin reductase (DIM6/NTAB) family NADH-FMN oxidoreductase RutF